MRSLSTDTEVYNSLRKREQEMRMSVNPYEHV